MQIFDVWKQVLVDPADAFPKYQRKASYTDALKHLVIGGVIAGILYGIGLFTIGTVAATKFGFLGAATGVVGFVTLVIATPIEMIIGWIVFSAIFYVMAMILKGKGSFLTQSYNMAIYTAPISVIVALFSLIPLLGGIINLLVGLYSLYLLTIALKSAHKFSTAKAFLTWFIPVIVIGIIIVLFTAAAFVAIISRGVPATM